MPVEEGGVFRVKIQPYLVVKPQILLIIDKKLIDFECKQQKRTPCDLRL
jgi:hypothetical protein